jgi:hypothetical protein
LVVTIDGFPLGYEVFPGNTHDSRTLQTIVATMEARHGVVGLGWTPIEAWRVQPANLTGRTIAIVVLGNSTWRVVRLHLDRVALAVNAATPGSYTEIDIPLVQIGSSATKGMFRN